MSFLGPPVHKKSFYNLKLPQKDSRYTIISFKASKKLDTTIIGRLLAAQNSILGHFLIKIIVFLAFGPPAEAKKCDESAETPKTESSDTYPSKLLYAPLYCSFWPQNSHFSLVWFKGQFLSPF